MSEQLEVADLRALLADLDERIREIEERVERLDRSQMTGASENAPQRSARGTKKHKRRRRVAGSGDP